MKLYYVFPAESRAGDTESQAEKIKEYFYFVANTIDARSVELGGPTIDVPVLCTEGVPTIFRLASKEVSTKASFSSLISELKAKGNDSTLAQYWSWYDGTPGNSPYAGQGTRDRDAVAGTSNANNVGPAYSFTYGGTGTTMLHEAGHNWGVVNSSAPHANRSHCYDENDFMCYDDDPDDGKETFSVCKDNTWDCNADDYFNPKPRSGSYLAQNWNTAMPYNEFLRFGPMPTTSPTSPNPNQPRRCLILFKCPVLQY